MATLEIIFIGLMALAPADDGQVLAMLSAEMDSAHGAHEPLIVQWRGTCRSKSKDGQCHFDSNAAQGKDDDRLCGEDGKLCWMPAGLEVTWDVTCNRCSDDQLQDSLKELKGAVPSIEAIVPLWARLRPSCRGDCTSCNVRSRVRIPSGTLAACHYIHHNEHTERLAVYDLGGRRGPVANVVSLAVPLDDAKVDLVARTYDREETVAQVTLEPETDDGEEKIALLVINEPDHGSNGNDGRVPQQLSHFKALYRLLHPFWNLPGRMSSRVPEFTELYVAGSPGTCEHDLVDLYKLLNTETSPGWMHRTQSAPHGPAECALASVP